MRTLDRTGRLAIGLVSIVLVAACAAPGGGQAGTSAATAPTASPHPTPTQPVARSGPLYDPNADARADIAAALTSAKADGKRVLLDFGADWCPDCHVLAAYLHGAAGSRLVDASFHVVPIDVGYWDHNVDVAATYGSPITQGIPAVVVLTPDGKIVGTTADGSLANASAMREDDVLSKLAAWKH